MSHVFLKTNIFINWKYTLLMKCQVYKIELHEAFRELHDWAKNVRDKG